jgi:hypothetical protein
MAILYVSLKHVRNSSSHKIASPAAMMRILLHPIVCAIAPEIAGPIAPPMSGASMIKLIAEPLCSLSKISPMIAGFSTLDATASPVSILAAMKTLLFWLHTARIVAAMNPILQAFITG